MDIYSIKKGKVSAKLMVLLLAVVIVATSVVIHIGNTMAAPAAINVVLKNESGISDSLTLEVGQTKDATTSNLFQALSTKPSVASVTFTKGSATNNLHVTGVKAGVAGIAFGTKTGSVQAFNYQVTDSNNISAYAIKDGGEVYFSGSGLTKSSPVTIPAGAGDFSRIDWRSTNGDIATVAANGAITSVGDGVTIVIGGFVDKWGVSRDFHILVSVGVKLSDSKLGDLLDLVNKGESILNDDPGQYTTDSLDDLSDAVNKGKDVLNSSDPSESEIQDAIDDLENSINNMQQKPTNPDGVLGPDENGDYYKPVGDPENIYEVVDENGDSKQPPEYVYNVDDPVKDWENNRPAYPGPDGHYKVEDPEGSNIWKDVNGDGTLKDSPAIWGGPDGKPGGGDDKTVVKKEDGAYWTHIGQNIWQKVEGPFTLGALTGGGGNENPATSPATPVYDNTSVNGKYYIGPLGSGSSQYYYGDKKTGGDGKVNSTANSLHSTDEKYYLKDGVMVPESQLPNIPGLNETQNGGTIVIDGMEWTKVRSDDTGKYALLLLNDVLPGDPVMYDSSHGFNDQYYAAGIRETVDAWYGAIEAPVLKKFAQTVNLGGVGYASWPSSSTIKDGMFPFIPKTVDLSTLSFPKLGIGVEYWTSTTTTYAGAVDWRVTILPEGNEGSKNVNQTCNIRPAIWVAQK